MAPTGTYNLAGTTWSKWQIALVVGAPVAVGLGYWYLKRRSVAAVKKGSDEKSSADIVKQESIDGTELAPSKDKNKQDPPKSPLVSSSSQFEVNASLLVLTNVNFQSECQKFKDKGNAFFKQQKFDEAITEYSKAIDLFPRNRGQLEELAKFHQNRAAAYEQLVNFSSFSRVLVKNEA